MSSLLHETYYAAVDTRAKSVTSSAADTEILNMNVISISGVIFDDHKHWSLQHSDELPVPSVVSDVVDSSGEWTSLAVNREGDRARYLIFGDYAGYAPIFYSLVPGKAIVASDSFSGVVQGLSAFGVTASLNLSNYLTLLTGRTATFDTLVSNQTMANEIYMLDPNQALVVDSERVAFIDRGSLSYTSQISSYEQALPSAVEYTSRVISHFISQNPNKQRLLTLTGGVDSRLVFGLLSTTPFLRDFRIWTMDPRKATSAYQKKVHTSDIEISNQIRKSYKLDWMPPRSREKVSVYFEESLARHQSYYSNFSFKYSPSAYVSLEGAPILTLRGGGGELLRGTGGARLTSGRYAEYRKNGGRLEQVRWAVDDYLERSFLTDDSREVAQDFLVQQLNKYTGTLLREKLDSFYRDTRNRAHFGHYRFSESANDYMVQVLSNPYFQRVTELSGYDFASSGGLIRDIFALTEPRLRKFPFENPSAHEQLYLSTRRAFKYKERDSWIRDFDRLTADSLFAPFRFMGSAEERGVQPRESIRSTALKFLQFGFDIIESITPVDYKRKLVVQHQKILKHVRREHLAIGKVVAKVASAVDIVAPMPLDGADHFFTNYESPYKIPPRDSIHDAATTYARFLTRSGE